MAQVTDRNIGANPTGFDMRTEINNIIAALESDNSGTSEPLNTVPYMKWLDTSNATYYYYKERNHDNTAWVTLFRYTVATKIMEAVNNGTDLTTTLALKAPLASPTFTGTVVLPSTTSIGTITGTELSYIDGVTSSIQTQLNAKQATLVSATNIKTINSTSLLGSGDIVISSTPTSEQVGTATAGLAIGAVGTYAFLALTTVSSAISAGSTYAGSDLNYTSVGVWNTNANYTYDLKMSGAPSGTWKAMGYAFGKVNIYPATIFLRIA